MLRVLLLSLIALPLAAQRAVLFDEAHNNFHTSTGRYQPFVELIAGDGSR